MEYALLGWPDDGPTLRLDHREFSYAGKFVMSTTGKAVAREADEVVAALAFGEDRSDGSAAWIRYVTVRNDRRGGGIGARLARFASDRLLERYDRVRIGVNNAFSYQALYKAGFDYTGRETGLAELVLARPGDRSTEAYRAGLDVFRGRERLSDAEVEFLAAKRDADPPAVLDGKG